MRRAFFLAAIVAGPLLAQDVTGLWLGTIRSGPTSLRVAVHINRNADGLNGTLDSLDQGANGIPISSVIQQGKSVKFEVQQVGGSYAGTLSTDASEMKGTWTQLGSSLPLDFKRTDKLPVSARPQEPKKPYPYKEEEVSYENKKAGVQFAGTLTLPRSAGPHPAVLLLTGSGPQNRNEEIAGHKPFLVLADYLTRKGIAVLRVDDRGVGGSGGKTDEGTTEYFAGDAIAGVEYLKARKEIDPRHIGLIGHSEGGLIAPLAATRSSDVAFIVMMAGPGVSGDKIIEVQSYAVPKAAGAPAELATANRDIAMLMVDAIQSEKELPAAQKRFRQSLDKLLAKWDDTKRNMVQPFISQAETQLKMLDKPWFRTFLALDPKPLLMKVKVPVLAINGELDTQVDASQNLPAIAAALKAGGNADFTTEKLAGLNHLFQTAKTGSPSEYQTIEETMAPAAMEAIASWILRHTAR
jgi:uncharacterized protein